VYLYFERFQEWLQGETHGGQSETDQLGAIS
jgi:hypothetical protein